MNDTECPYVAGYICMCCIIWELLLVYRDVLWTKNKVVVLCCRRQRIIFNSLIKNWPSLKFPLIQFSRKYQYPNTLGLHEKYWNILFQIFLYSMIFKKWIDFTILLKYYKKNSKPLEERKHFPSRITLFSLSFMISI